jgi:hypothetical protein
MLLSKWKKINSVPLAITPAETQLEGLGHRIPNALMVEPIVQPCFHQNLQSFNRVLDRQLVGRDNIRAEKFWKKLTKKRKKSRCHLINGKIPLEMFLRRRVK